MTAIPDHLGQLTVDRHGDAPILRGPGDPSITLPPSEDALRRHTRLDDSGRYRPLSGARTLAAGWQVETGEALPLERAIEAVYPLALTHLRLHAEGELPLVTLDDVLSRQTGRYEHAARLSHSGRNRAIRLLCGQCVRIPVWDGRACTPGAIPCPEPCSVLVSLCREAVLWENDPPSPASADPRVAFAAFDEPGNELREAFLADMPPPPGRNTSSG